MFVELWSKSMLPRRSTFTSLTVTHFKKFSQHEQDATCAQCWLRLDRWHTFRFACKARAHNTNKMWFANYLLLLWNDNVHPFHLCCCVADRIIFSITGEDIFTHHITTQFLLDTTQHLLANYYIPTCCCALAYMKIEKFCNALPLIPLEKFLRECCTIVNCIDINC